MATVRCAGDDGGITCTSNRNLGRRLRAKYQMGKIETFILDLYHGLIECLPINASTVLRRHAILTVPLQRFTARKRRYGV